MANIRDVVHRIQSVSATQQITNAMKMVAVAKLGKVQQHMLPLRAYTEQLTTILDSVVTHTDQQGTHLYHIQRPIKNLLLVVMGSDRGLCGAFNNNVLKKTLQHIQVATPGLAEDQITILPIGNKVLSLFKKKPFHLVPDHIGLVRHLSFAHVRPVVTMLTEAFLQQVYDQIVLVYNAYQHAATYLPTVEKLLPIVVHDVAPSHQGEPIDYIYEPSPAALRLSLLPHVLQVRFYSALLAAYTSEHAARMIAMSKATENAETLLKDLRLTYNRTRQAAITQEISEIVAGANVLTG